MHKFNLESEGEICNSFSPGCVKESETLLRITLHPDHINEKDEVLPSAVSIDDLKCRGFSVEREEHCNKNELKKRALEQVARKHNRKFAEFAKISCGEVRLQTFNDERAFLVIDEALEENIAHASIYSASNNLPKSQLRKLRNQFLPFLENRIKIIA